jgi:hypothetical protein
MKTKTLFTVAVALLVVLAVVGGYASEEQPVAVDEAMKMFEGTYENNEYSSWTYPQKCDITSDGTIVQWSRSTSKKPSWIGDITIVNSWADTEGNLYCQVDVSFRNDGHNQALWKLDITGGILEINYTETVGHEYPQNIEPDPDLNASPKLVYLIYNRQ